MDDTPLINPADFEAAFNQASSPEAAVPGAISAAREPAALPAEDSSQPVNVINPEGKLVSIPASQLQDALSAGYRQASAEHVAAHIRHEKYGSVGQQVKTAAEGVAEGLAGPLAPMAETALGIAKPEDIQGRAEENPTTKTVSEIGGLAAPALISGGTSLAARLGARGAAEALPAISAASKLTQSGLLESAGTAVAEGLGLTGKSGYIAKALEHGTKAAVEGAIYQGGKELSEAYLGDPSKVADHAIADIGMTAVLTGLFGGAFGAAANALSKKAPSALVSQADVAGVEAGDLKTLIAVDPAIPAAKKSGLLSELNIFKKKPNAPEIERAAQELGLPATPGMTLDSKLVQSQVDALAHSPYSMSGQRIGEQLNTAYDAAENALKTTTESANQLSRDELGHSIQDSLSKSIREAYAPQKAAFEELASLHESIPVKPEAIEGLAKAFNEIKEVKIGNTQEGRLVREVLDLAKNVKTAEDLTTIRNMAALKPEGIGSDPMGWLKGKIRDELAIAQEDAIRSYSKSFPRNDEAGAFFASKLDAANAAREGYKPYIKKLNALSGWLGKGKIHGTEDALNFMNERLSATDVAKRLFSSSKDPEFLKFFSKEFPDQYQMVRDYQRMDMLDAAKRDGVLSPKTFLKKFNDLEPEIQKSLYTPEEIKKIKALDVYFKEAFPKNFNPSGTDHTHALRAAFESPKGLIRANVRDSLMEKMIQYADKGSPMANAHTIGKATARGWKMAADSTKAVFDSAKDLPSKIIPLAAHRDKLDKLVAETVKNPERLYGINDNNPAPEFNGQFAASSARVVAYLNTLRPQTDPKAPLDSKNIPSKAQEATYHRALDIAQQPLVTMKFLKDGTLTSQDVIALKSMYPVMYDQLSERLTNEMIRVKDKGTAIPYKTKMALSLFLGQPLDSTMTPMAIMAAQPSPQQQPQQQGGSKPPSYNSVKGLDSLAKGARTPAQSSASRNLAKD